MSLLDWFVRKVNFRTLQALKTQISLHAHAGLSMLFALVMAKVQRLLQMDSDNFVHTLGCAGCSVLGLYVRNIFSWNQALSQIPR